MVPIAKMPAPAPVAGFLLPIRYPHTPQATLFVAAGGLNMVKAPSCAMFI
jgi:hypothetical protein